MAPRTEAFARHAEALNRLADKTCHALRNPTMTIGASTNIGIYLLQPMFKDFCEINGGSLNDLKAITDTILHNTEGKCHHLFQAVSAISMDHALHS